MSMALGALKDRQMKPDGSLVPWTSHAVRRPDGGELTVTAVPAVHGPEDGERDADGFVNCEVIGFVLSGQDLPAIYVSGDNASIRTVTEIARRTPPIDAVVLHAGAARVPGKFRDRALSLDSIRAAAAAAILAPAVVIPAHYDGWAHFSEGRDASTIDAISERVLSERLKELEQEGVVERRVLTCRPVHVEYRLTRKGAALGRVVRALGKWADEWDEAPPAPAPRPARPRQAARQRA